MYPSNIGLNVRKLARNDVGALRTMVMNKALFSKWKYFDSFYVRVLID